MKYQSLLLFLFTIFIVMLIVRNTPVLSGKMETMYFDYTNFNSSVHVKQDVEKILDNFETISVNKLPPSYLKHSKMTSVKYAGMVSTMEFFQITKKDTYKKIVGDLRIKDFIVKDDQLLKAKYGSTTPIYWGIKPSILFKLLELKTLMESRNLDFDAITINSGHRTPHINEKVGGASKSRHIVGEAVDLKIGDVDQDGFRTADDKNKVLKICDLELIKDQGGVGKYPGTMVIHIDTRGYRARWNTY